MALGPDGAVCTDELAEAMRARLDQLDPPAGDNVDEPDVRANFAALGAGVHAVLTAPGRAETRTAAAQDAAFWAWVAGLTTHATAVASWQAGVRAAVTAWAPADVPGQALRAAVLALPAPPGPAPAAPTALTGIIR